MSLRMLLPCPGQRRANIQAQGYEKYTESDDVFPLVSSQESFLGAALSTSFCSVKEPSVKCVGVVKSLGDSTVLYAHPVVLMSRCTSCIRHSTMSAKNLAPGCLLSCQKPPFPFSECDRWLLGRAMLDLELADTLELRTIRRQGRRTMPACNFPARRSSMLCPT